MPKKTPQNQPDRASNCGRKRSSRCKQDHNTSHQNNASVKALMQLCGNINDFKQSDQLLNTIAQQIRILIASEGSAILLMEKGKNEIVAKAVSFEDVELAAQFRAECTPIGEGKASRLCEISSPLIINSEDSSLSSEQIAGGSISNRIVNRLDVPIKTLSRTIGVLSAINKTNGDFNQHDAALLSSVAGITALALENIRIRESLSVYYRQMKDFSRAKDRVIHQLSHALKTPLAVLIASLKLLRKYTSASADTAWLNVYDRAQRNLDRLLTIEYEMEDILQQRKDNAHDMTSLLSDIGERPTACCDDAALPSDIID